MGMIFCQKVKVDSQLLKEKWQLQAIGNNAKENQHRKNHAYKVGDLILIVEPKYERSKKAKLLSKVPLKSFDSTQTEMYASGVKTMTRTSPSAAYAPTTLGTPNLPCIVS
jgi:hypothetical protein